jgi:dTDP-glucose 4,6-dehydratase
VVPAFLSQALKGEPLSIYGDGSQTRSFCFVSDLVEGLVRLLASDHHDPVNLGNPEEHTILEFARIVARVMGHDGRKVHEPLPTDDPKVRQPDITKARTLLGWLPQVTLEDGLRATADYFRGRVVSAG